MTVVSESDLEEFRDSVRAALAEVSPPAKVRAVMAGETGFDPDTWRVVATQLELAGLMLPEALGGGGMSMAEFAVAVEECGAALLCSPLFATSVLAVPLLLELGDESYSRAIAAGTLHATVAFGEGVTATPAGDGWRLTGTVVNVVDGATAGLVLVVASTPGDARAVSAVSGGFSREPLVTLDQTRKMATLSFADTEATLVGPADAGGALARAAAVSRTLLAAESTGVAQRALDLVVAYAKTRLQFGRLIGSFQAVKQRLADALIEVESARSAVYAAARSTGDELERNSRIAAIMATEAAEHVTAECIQLHGGIGFTWEHDAHLYFKRARTSASLLGTVDEHVAALADILDRETV
jgi:alkylation response protein AidB-like acyl-CoA dehydrogenase